MKKNNQKILYFLGALLFCLLLSYSVVLAQTQSPDAIAVRVLPNAEHYSAARWYEKQGFTGSPQEITVDGYEAVRDGRTVYVNAGNVQNSVLFTNIYLLSFNQDAENSTVDIVSKILSHWKFNSNYTTTGTCNISTTKECLYSEDCPTSEYCLSPKARMIRDTRRLSDLAEIKILLEEYRNIHGYYPILASGSYIAHTTISVWPSWQKLFAQHLGKELPVDPINALGDCGDPKFDKVTCWDDKDQIFADSNPGNNVIDLPANSNAYIYTVSADGLRYSLNGNIEGGYGAGTSDNDINGGVGSGGNGTEGNGASGFTGQSLIGKSGEKFNGYLRIINNNPKGKVKVTIDTSGATWTNWSAAPKIEEVPSVPNQRNVHAEVAGNAGNYFFNATIDDGLGLANSITTKTFMITITNDPPTIIAVNQNYIASTTNPLNVSFQVKDALSNYPLTYSFTPDVTAYGLSPTTFLQVGNVYILNLKGVLNPLTENPINTTRSYPFTISATDKFGAVSSKDFSLNVKDNKPTVNVPLPCELKVRVGYDYTPCKVTASDIDGNAITSFSFGNIPSQGTMNGSSNGIISGKPSYDDRGVSSISVNATDEYGAVSLSTSYSLHVNTYCGDEHKQTPNMEGRGGTSDGQEQCDGTDGLAINPAESNINKQYACTTPSLAACPLFGPCVGACIFLIGPKGGYCGDGISQDGTNGSTNFGEQCDDGPNASGADKCDTFFANTAGHGYCTKTFCGDNVVQHPNGANVNETCDEGSNNGMVGGTCYATCALSYCGDGMLQVPNGYGISEVCDNGASNANTAQCNLGCQLTYCGDGVVQSQNGVHLKGTNGLGHEVCDGNTCGTGNQCVDCACQCIPCKFDSTNFDQCCFQ